MDQTEHVKDAPLSPGGAGTQIDGRQIVHQPVPTVWPYSDTTPKLAQLTTEMLFDDLWERPALSKRDRSMITVTALIAAYRPLAMPFHLKLALDNGVTREELVEIVTHLAPYAGWPSATSAAEILGSVFREIDGGGQD
jgi:4-carboxymuconolactone decarboxylase